MDNTNTNTNNIADNNTSANINTNINTNISTNISTNINTNDFSMFDTIIGYEEIKDELMRVTDALRNTEAYRRAGTDIPKGMLLYGVPGVGKSLMADVIINSSGRNAYVCRKDMPGGAFVNQIKETFDKAIENEPAIVFLDDLDKFTNGDERFTDAEEYVTVQSCIDRAKNYDVFVLATANKINVLPDSLLRSGRFDVKIEIEPPRGSEALAIIKHYLKGKNLSDDIDYEVLARLLEGHSCADLETVINEAARLAVYARDENICMDHILEACFRTIFQMRRDAEYYDEEDKETEPVPEADIICHEAGHAVIAELLEPGSVTLINAKYLLSGKAFTSIHHSREMTVDCIERHILVTMGGKAALELMTGKADGGCKSDLDYADTLIYRLIAWNAVKGVEYHIAHIYNVSDKKRNDVEKLIAAEKRAYYDKAYNLLAENRELLQAMIQLITEKRIITMRDIKPLVERYAAAGR